MATSGISFVTNRRLGEERSHEYPPQSYAEYPQEPEENIARWHNGSTSATSPKPEAQAGFPTWFNSGFKPLAPQTEEYRYSDLEVDRHAQSAQRAPEVHVVENSMHISPQFDADGLIRETLLRNYTLDDTEPSKLETGGHPGKFKLTGSKVLVKRAPKEDVIASEMLQREVDVLRKISDPKILKVHELLESDVAIWSVLDYAAGVTLRQYISTSGPQSIDMIKSFTTQLFSGIASIFNSGFAHLRLCDETILISTQSQLIISSFGFAYPYGKEKIDTLYAGVEDKCGDDIYVAPEVFASIKYNARKAVIWSCGVVIYFMTTATTTSLSVLNHPSFDTINPASNGTATDPAPSASHRKLSTASQQALKVPLIPYPIPGGRLSIPAWTRDIISKMLQVAPLRRAELIEVAAKVPKEYSAKETRPLMELAWLDYKNHVGPLAGLNEGGGDSESNSMFSFGRMSAFSRDSLGALLPGKRKSTIAKASREPAELAGVGGRLRSRSLWL